MNYTEEQINEYRQQWLEQLRNPEAKKAKSVLESTVISDARCCLGHACHALEIDKSIDTNLAAIRVMYGNETLQLPEEAQEKLNITSSGSFKKEIRVKLSSFEGDYPYEEDYPDEEGCLDSYLHLDNLIDVNDETDLSPQEIADIIQDQFKNNNFNPY